MPRVSVIIPTRNRADFLPAATDSARHAGSDVEVIVVDDDSTDETSEICQNLPGIRYIRLPHNVGLAGARNAGILASNAESVAFLDDDDIRLPGSIDSQLRALDTSPRAAFCYGRVLIADSSRQLPTGEILPKHCPSGDIFWELLEQNFIPVPSVVARREAVIEAGLFGREPLVEDWQLWLRLSEVRPVVSVHEPVAVYRRADRKSGQLSSNFASMYDAMRHVQATALKLPRAIAASPWKRNRARHRLVNGLYHSLLYEATTAFAAGDQVTSQTVSHEAMRLRPIRGRTDLALLSILRGLKRLKPSGSKISN